MRPDAETSDAKRKALLIIRRQAERIEELESSQSAPIAVVGLACRLPGGGDAREFWRMLESGSCATAEVPADRWDIDRYYSDVDAPGKMCTRFGAFLDQIDGFDPRLFGISNREAAALDPQHRLLLEVSWEALENAGYRVTALRGSRTGVFIGIASSEYAQIVAALGEEAIDTYAGTGTAHSAGVGRISYLFDFEGPNLAIDTACSSSLVSVHQACQSLRSKESDLALAGGVNAILTPAAMISFSRARMLAPDGRCKTFDASADGFVRGEGCGLVVLKRLADAQRDGDRIVAVIRGSAINQDGRSAGLTAPNGPAQQRVMEAALQRAGVEPHEVAYLEAHGTGTALGDPIEVQAAAAVLGKGRDRDRPLLIGSVKTNIGHLEAAAGVAGLIKVILSMEHGRIPRHLHFDQPNPHIAWEQLPVEVTREARAWPEGKKIAGVSSFGFSGTNAHVVVEEGPEAEEGEVEKEQRTHVLALSARDETALRALAERYVAWLGEHPEASLADVAYTAGVGRAHFETRAAVIASTVEEARERLSQLVRGERAVGVFGSGENPAAAAYVAGETPDFAAWDWGGKRRKLALPSYPFQRRRYWLDAPRSSSDDEYYQIAWQAAPAVETAVREREQWLLMADRQGYAERLARLFEARGQRCELARSSADLAGVLRAPDRVVELRGMDLPEAIGESAFEQLEGMLADLAELARGLKGRGWAAPVHIVTRSAQAVAGGDRVEPLQTAIWGASRVWMLELPELWGGIVDVAAEESSEALVDALLARDGEDQVAVRKGQRWTPRLRRLAGQVEPAPMAMHGGGTYLITGGWGALGLRTAGWVAERGGGCVVLVGRGTASEEAQAAIAELRRRYGCRVELRRADVSRREHVEELLDWIAQHCAPLRGIVHLAGTAARRRLLEVEAEDWKAALGGKARGLWHLEEGTRGLELDFFVAFSSIASVWGSQGQAAYAAANAFLDGWSGWRRGEGRVALSVQYGPWSGGGMATPEARRWLEQNGLKLLSPEKGLRALEQLTQRGCAQAVAASVDWERFGAVYQARGKRGAFLSEVLPEVERKRAPRKIEARSGIEQAVRQALGEVLHMAPEEVDRSTGFFELGMDSLMAVEFRGRLEQALGVSLPATLAMDRPRVDDVVDYVLAEVYGQGTERAAVAAGKGRREGAIAVIGLACRVPGAENAEEFWKLLAEGRDAITEIPASRWDVEAYYDPDPGKPGKMYTRYGGFLKGVEEFDSELFGIAPREAASMDPQQRLALELSWEALEDAGMAPQGPAGAPVGVYLGAGANEYASLLAARGVEAIDGHYLTGNAMNAIAGRVAYVLGLEGPALVVDTACSSSLVAVHAACQALRAGECGVALAGGVNLVLSPQSMIATCRARMLAADGRAKTFDAAADGYVRGEGGAVVVLKRWEEAERDGDRVLAVIGGSAVNQDGRASGMTVPHGPAQQRVIEAALAQAGVEPGEVGYLEAHGTGTALGDPIEVQAAAAALGAGRKARLVLGSVKTNIGHLEAAAGVAGLVKVVLSMQQGVIPRHLHWERPNPHIGWERLPVEVAGAARGWPEGTKIAGVSSFGFSGTNAHVVLWEAPRAVSEAREETGGDGHVLLLSGRSEGALKALAARYREWMEKHAEASLADIAYTAGTGRSHLEERGAVVARTAVEARELLGKLVRGESAAGLYRGRARERRREDEPVAASLEEVAERYVTGSTPDLAAWYGGPRRKLALPTYPFQRQRHWVDRLEASHPNVHPLLGSTHELASGDVVYETTLSASSPYIQGHTIYGVPVAPAAVFMTMAISAQPMPVTLREVLCLEPLVVPAGESRRLQLTIKPTKEPGERTFEVHGRPIEEGSWTLHCHGIIATSSIRTVETIALPSSLEESQAGNLYDRFAAIGLELGYGYRAIQRLESGNGLAFAEIAAPDEVSLDGGLPASPQLLDACTQLTGAVASAEEGEADLFLPVRYGTVTLFDRLPRRFYCRARLIAGSVSDSRSYDLDLFDESGRVLGRIDGFVVRRAPKRALLRNAGGHAGSLIHQIKWRPVQRPTTSPRSPGTWLLYGETFEESEPLAREFGEDSILVAAAPDFVRHSNRRFSLSPGTVSHWDRLLEDRPLAGVVILPALHATTTSADALMDGARAVCAAPLALVQALIRRDLDLSSGLWILTRGAVALERGEPVWPLSSLRLGFGRVAASEHPRLNVRLLDLDAVRPISPKDLASLLACSGTPPEQVWRDGSGYVPELTPVSASARPVTIRNDATYLITGGLGALGQRTSQWLADKGARHIVLSSRRAPAMAIQAIESDLAARGCACHVIAADVSRAPDIDALFARIGDLQLPPLRGVIHAAGVLDDGMITQQSWDRFEGVLEAKVTGAWRLHEATERLPLDFFALYASAASLFGVPGQSNYAAANSFLDGLAFYRISKGLPATVIDWGPWADLGMTSSRTVQTRLRSRGVEALHPDQALRALDQLLGDGMPQAVVARVNRALWNAGAESELLKQLTETPAEDRMAALMAHLQREVRLVLGVSDPPALDDGFFNLGMDSLLGNELLNRLQTQIGPAHRLPSTTLFDYPTVSDLAGHLAGRLFGSESAKPKHAARRKTSEEPVAIVGMACRFPGARNVDSYWRLLRDGVDAIREVPRDRWDIDELYDPDTNAPGKMSTRYGGFLDGIDQFDPRFFGISPREAMSLDPQQRLLLEIAWEALEDGGLSPRQLFGSNTGVYIGIGSNDYGRMLAARGSETIDQYMGTGNAPSAAVGRLSFVLGFQGPSLAIDTACSASLVALNQACRALLAGDCEVALAGGVNAILSPENTIYFSKARMMAPDGRCKTFDAAADGYVRGEGCGIVVLKRLGDAQRDGDRIWAVVRASAVNQDGRSSGLTVPNGPSQVRVMRDALAQANLEPADVPYVEAHGTGTALGDPIEIQSLESVFGNGSGRKDPLLVGSVKTNFGHLEAAAGVAGVIKVALALHHGLIPPSLHFHEPSPRIAWNEIAVKVADRAVTWPPGRRTAGVSAFAFSGTNAHVILEEAPAAEEASDASQREWHVLPLSAREEPALRELAERYVEWLGAHPDAALADVAYTAAVGRSHMEERAAVVARSVPEARQLLSKLVAGESASGLYRKGEGGEPSTPAEELASRYVTGATVDFAGWDRAYPRSKLALPTYPFQRRRYWMDPPRRKGWGEDGRKAHPLLGMRKALGTGEVIYSQPVGCAYQGWLADHQVFGKIVAPGAFYLAAALASETGPVRLSEGVFARPLVLNDGEESREMQVVIQPGEGARKFAIYSQGIGEEHWTLHVEGKLEGGTAVPAAEEMEDLRNRLKEEPVEGYYEAFASVGIELGEAFQGLARLWVGEGEAVGEVRRPAGLEGVGGPIHPAVLDACLQVVGAARGKDWREAYVPFQWGEVEMWESVGERFYCAARLREGGAGETLEADLWVMEEGGRAIGRIQGYVARRVSRESLLGGEGPEIDSWLYEVAWKEQEREGEWPSPESVARRVREEAAGLIAEAGLEEETAGRLDEEMEAVSRAYAREALESVAPENVAAAQRRLYGRLGQIASKGMEPASEGLQRLKERYPQARLEATLLERCGQRLPEVLRGECDPLGLLFPTQGVSAEQVYRDAPGARLLNRMVERTLAAVVAQAGEQRKIRVLEVGAGTGATTLAALRSLPRERTEYTYTDISAGFFDAAQRRLGEYPEVRYRVLDIERGVEEQRFERGQYDVVIAAHVLHATRDLGASVRHARELLAEGGLLIVVEGLRGQSWLDVTFGQLEGWWRFADQWREQGPLVGVDRWREVLGEAGIGGVEAMVPWGESPQGVLVGRAEGAGNQERGWWLIAGGGEVGARAAERMREKGWECEVAAGRGAEGESAEYWEERLKRGAPSGVAHLCSLDGAGELEEDLRHSGASLLGLVQAMVRREAAPRNGLWVVTEGGQGVEGEGCRSLAQSGVWGMGKVIALEHPELGCRRVDLERGRAREQIAAAVEEWGAGGSEDHIAWRGARRLVARLQRVEKVAQKHSLRLSGDKTYLITGGLGGLGLQVARWAIERGARYLVLNGRRPPDRAAENIIERLREQQGTEVDVVLADVSQEADVDAMLARARSGGRRLGGVFHLAGALRDGALLNQGWGRFEEVLGPKALGAWHLHRHTAADDVELFVMFSSTVSLLGNRGQANHAAANMFLDMLAEHRLALGQAGTSINWGAWSKVGAAAERHSELEKSTAQAGMRWISPEAGIQALERILASGRSRVTVLPIDWEVFQTRLGHVPALLRGIVTSSAARPRVAGSSGLLRRIKQAPRGSRLPVVEEFIIEQLVPILRLEAPPDVSTGFFDLGMDSLMAVELRNRLNTALDLDPPLSATILFDHPTVAALARCIVEQLDGHVHPADEMERQTAPSATVEPAIFPETVSLDDLTYDELSTLLDQRVEHILSDAAGSQ